MGLHLKVWLGGPIAKEVGFREELPLLVFFALLHDPESLYEFSEGYFAVVISVKATNDPKDCRNKMVSLLQS